MKNPIPCWLTNKVAAACVLYTLFGCFGQVSTEKLFVVNLLWLYAAFTLGGVALVLSRAVSTEVNQD